MEKKVTWGGTFIEEDTFKERRLIWRGDLCTYLHREKTYIERDLTQRHVHVQRREIYRERTYMERRFT